jgi:hypothetical protein
MERIDKGRWNLQWWFPSNDEKTDVVRLLFHVCMECIDKGRWNPLEELLFVFVGWNLVAFFPLRWMSCEQVAFISISSKGREILARS